MQDEKNQPGDQPGPGGGGSATPPTDDKTGTSPTGGGLTPGDQPGPGGGGATPGEETPDPGEVQP